MLSSELYKILSDGISGNQSDLVEILKQKGIETTQSSVSRALRKIGAVKKVGLQGGVVYSLPVKITRIKEEGGFLGSLVNNINDNGYVIVIKTHSGTANTVAQFLDEQGLNNTLGTIAGDDTIMIIPKDVAQIKSITSKIKEIVGIRN